MSDGDPRVPCRERMSRHGSLSTAPLSGDDFSWAWRIRCEQQGDRDDDVVKMLGLFVSQIMLARRPGDLHDGDF